MNWSITSLSSPSPQVYSSSEEDTTAETTPTYLSPVQAPPYHPAGSQSLTGLGISFCETAAPFNNPGLYRPSEAYSLPVPGWTDPTRMSEPFNEPTLGVGRFIPEMELEPYLSYADISNSPLSQYSTQAMMQSSCYGGNHGTFLGQPPETWPTPRSGDVSPSNLGEMEELHEIREQPSFADVLNTTEVPLLPQDSQHPAQGPFPSLFYRDSGSLFDFSPNVGRDSDSRRGSTVQRTPAEPDSRSDPADKPFRRRQLSSESDRKCNVCDFTFTRTSNCRDHMKKKHDPNCKKTHFCEICPWAFRRRPDLTRHVDCVRMCVFSGGTLADELQVHRKLKRFSCECGRRFSRQDILSRWVLRGQFTCSC